MWNLLIVVISVILSAPLHSAAPTGDIRNALYDRNLLPVLAECDLPENNPVVRSLCNLYFSVVQNRTAAASVKEEFAAYIATPDTQVEGFCVELLKYPGIQGYIANVESCEKKCRTYDEKLDDIVRPLCRLIQWRLEVQKVGQFPSQTEELSVPTQGGSPTVKTAVVVGNTTTQVANYTQKPSVTPPGLPSNGAKMDIPTAVVAAEEGGTTSTKTLQEPPKDVKSEKTPVPEEAKTEVEAPKNGAEVKPSNQPTKEDPKPVEEAKKEPEVRPDIEEDPNESFKDMEDDDTPDDYNNLGEREEPAAVIKGNTNNLDPDVADPIFDSSDAKENPPGDKMEVVDAKRDPFQEEDESNFFTYFMCMMIVCIVAYVVYHNKTKVLALVLEGRRSSQGRGRRKHTAAYRKLDSNLEEAITSSAASRTSQVIY